MEILGGKVGDMRARLRDVVTGFLIVCVLLSAVTFATLPVRAAGPSAGIANFGTLTLTDCTVSGNAAPSGNGGIGNDGGTLMLVHTTVSGNSAVSAAFGGGAGIFNDDNGTVILTNSTVSGNNGR